MKTKFLLSLASLLCATGAWAATNYTVGTASEFAEAWGKLAEGDTITLTADVSLSGVNLSPTTVRGVTITSATGAQHTLLAAPPLGDVALSQVSLENSRSSVEALISVEGDTQFGPGVEVRSTAGGAVVVNDGASLTVSAGSCFRNNTAAAEGPAVYVDDQQNSGKVNLMLQAAAGADTIFEGNTADAGGYTNDVYLGKNATMQVAAAAGSSVSLHGGVMSDASGTAAVVVTGEGSVLLGDGSYYTGSLTLQGGKTTIAGTTWGSGEGLVEVQRGATLCLTEGAQLNVSLSSAGILSVGRATLGADTTLGGQVEFCGEALVVMGSLQLEEALTFTFEGYKAGEYLLIDNYGSFTGSVEHITLSGSNRFTYELGMQGSDVYLTVTSLGNDLSWLGGKKATWGVDSATLWGTEEGTAPYADGDHVFFTIGCTVSIEGSVAPGSITVTSTKAVTFKTSYNKKTGEYSGLIVGETTSVEMDGGAKGKLTMNNGNTYGGGTYLRSGTLKVGGVSSFGTGDVYAYGGTLDLASKAIDNDIVQEGAATIKSGKNFTGEFTMNSGELLKGSVLNIAESATLQNGTINGTLSGVGTVAVTGEVSLGANGKITTNGLDVDGTLNISNKGLAMNTKASAISVNEGGTLVSEGAIKAYSMEVDNGEVELAGAKAAAVTLTQDLQLHNEATMDIFGTVTTKGQLLLDTGADLTVSGKVSAASLEMDGATLTMSNAKPQSLALTGKTDADKKPIYNNIVGSTLLLNGSMSVAANLVLNNATIQLRDANTTKPKALGLAVKGDLTLGGNSLLYLSGALSAKNLTLGSGSIYMTGEKLQTIKVSNELTLNGGTNLNFGFSITQKDFDKNKAFKIITFKVLDAAVEAADLYSLLGLSEDICTLAFDKSRKSITLVVDDMDAWNEQAEAVRKGEVAATAVEATEAAEEAEEMLFAPTADAAVLEPELAKVADTLVQSTWGTVGASRAFGDTIANRGAHGTLLDGGKGAAWISTMGGSSRISSDGAHAGADYTLTGAAFGMEAHITDASVLGLAVGNSWGKVSTFSAYPVDQDSTHMGIYGNHKLNDTLSLSWMAAHTRTESDVNLAGLPCSWSQDALQLDARLTWARALTTRTTVNAFGGLQYLATDSGECNGIETGSLQNLRAEIGVGATHQLCGNTLAYGELSFVGDMVRNNPTADLGGIRSQGTNPGRAGMNLSVGAAHRLNNSWSINASYNLELMQNITSHSLNVGATYSF